jgi:response regulator of citrate/malate metabolism
MPKGLNPKTLETIRQALRRETGDHTCESISDRSGLSRVTVRHYLNYLIETGELTSAIDYETGGRPRVLYRVN